MAYTFVVPALDEEPSEEIIEKMNELVTVDWDGSECGLCWCNDPDKNPDYEHAHNGDTVTINDDGTLSVTKRRILQ